MIAPPKALAAAAVRPSKMLVTIGYIRRQRDDTSLKDYSPRVPGDTEKRNSHPRAPGLGGGPRSPGMANMQDVAILHDVVFAFKAQGAFAAGVGFGAGFEKLVPTDRLGADEVFFQIGVDGAGGFLG